MFFHKLVEKSSTKVYPDWLERAFALYSERRPNSQLISGKLLSAIINDLARDYAAKCSSHVWMNLRQRTKKVLRLLEHLSASEVHWLASAILDYGHLLGGVLHQA